MCWSFWITMAAAFGLGALGGVHVPINGALSPRLHSTRVATFAFYGVAFGGATVICLLAWDARSLLALRDVPLWYYNAGLISVIVVGGSTYLVSQIGAVNLFVMMFSAQMSVRMVISHYGWFDTPHHPVHRAGRGRAAVGGNGVDGAGLSAASRR